MNERGLVIGGEVLEGTDWVQRVPGKFWEPGQRGTRKRAEEVTGLCGHWTAGEAGTQTYDDDGARVFDVMVNRRRDDGSPLNVGIHFVVAACGEDDEFAQVFQLMDPGLAAAVHVGRGWVNAKTIGVEVISAGLPGKADVRGRPRVKTTLLGKRLECLDFYGGQVRSWVRLANLLSVGGLPCGIEIPRQVPLDPKAHLTGKVLTSRRFTVPEAKRWRGAWEHYLVPGTTKIDAGGLLLAALAADGWEPVKP